MAILTSFISLLIREGSFQNPGPDYEALRLKYLNGLDKFLPNVQTPQKSKSRNNFMHNCQATGSLIKNSFILKGGHLESPNKKLFYVRIPKAASTALSFQLLKSNFPELPDSLNAIQINFLADVWLKTSSDSTPKDTTGFTVVRNPFHRLVSVYRDFFEHRRDEFFIYDDYLLRILPKTLSFAEFVERISRIPDRLKDQHFRPQCLFVEYYKQRNIPVQIFKLEESGPLKEFMERIGLRLTHLNKSAGSYDYRDYYSPQIEKLVRSIYYKDLELFRYAD